MEPETVYSTPPRIDRTRSSLRTAVSVTLKIAVTVTILLFIVQKLGWRSIVSTLSHTYLLFLFYALALFVVSGFLGAIQWRILLATREIDLSFGRSLGLYFIGMFFNNFIFGTVAGDAVRIAYIKGSHGKLTKGLAATFLDRFAGLWAMCGFAMAGIIFLLLHEDIAQGALWWAMATLIVMFIVFAGLMALFLFEPVQKFFFRILDRVPFPGKSAIGSIVRETIIESRHRRLLLPVALLAATIQLMRVGVHILCAVSLGIVSPSNIHYFFIFVPILAMVMIVPLPFGVREGLGGTLYALAGFQIETAMVMNFLASIVGIAASLPGGILFVTTKMKRGNRTP
jgi:hypothetical protein